MTIVERTNHLKDLINSGHCSADDIAEQITQACAEAIERAAKVAEAQKHFDDAGMIRALRPGEK